MPRKGITPVVAIVLLLMMTVAAAGGAYTWVTGIIGQGQEDATSDLNREITVRDVACDAGNANVDFFLSNTGSTDVDASSTTVYLYSVSTGNLEDTSDESGSTISPGGDWDSSVTSWSGGTGSLNSGQQYRVEFEFDNEDGYSVEGTCQAQ